MWILVGRELQSIANGGEWRDKKYLEYKTERPQSFNLRTEESLLLSTNVPYGIDHAVYQHHLG